MRLRHIEAFNAVMLTGTVRDAAKLINVTQSAVSRVLQHAELQLGFPLEDGMTLEVCCKDYPESVNKTIR